jgi:hypothetical protein
MNHQERIDKALEFAMAFGTEDGDHHKMWVIDQMVRALTGCPIVTKTTKDGFEYETQGRSAEYDKFLSDFADGEDGPHTFSWHVGIAP